MPDGEGDGLGLATCLLVCSLSDCYAHKPSLMMAVARIAYKGAEWMCR